MEIAMDKKVKVENLCAWPVYFARQIGNGDVKIPNNGVALLTVEEIQAQVFGGTHCSRVLMDPVQMLACMSRMLKYGNSWISKQKTSSKKS